MQLGFAGIQRKPHPQSSRTGDRGLAAVVPTRLCLDCSNEPDRPESGYILRRYVNTRNIWSDDPATARSGCPSKLNIMQGILALAATICLVRTGSMAR
jgi:hypothetical protein